MATNDFTTSVLVNRSPEEVFNAVLNVSGWWSGLYSEEIKGSSNRLNDEFSFRAGGGAHYSRQKLIELVPGKRAVWLVTDSNLAFLAKPDEWTGTSLCFDISKEGKQTRLRFTHVGLVPHIQCYEGCSTAWRQYFQGFAAAVTANHLGQGGTQGQNLQKQSDIK